MDELQRKKTFMINFAYFALIVFIYYVLVKYVVTGLMPFVLAGLVAIGLNAPIEKLANALRLPRRGAAMIVLVIFYALVAGLLTLIILRIVWSVLEWFGQLPMLYGSYIEPLFLRLIEFYNTHVADASANREPFTQNMINEIMGNLSSVVSSISRLAIGFARNMVVGTPTMLLKLLFSILATIFLCFDYPEISYFAINQFNPKGQRIVNDARRYIKRSFSRMIRSYAIIMTVTWIELCIGFTLMQMEDAAVLAIVVAIFDILPAVGTGTILLPWAIISLLNGDMSFAGSLVLLWGIITVVRNYLEPRIVGGQLGLNPVLMLMSMYLGVKVFGALGFVVLPFSIIVIKNLNDSGMIHVFNSRYLRKEQQPPKEKKRADDQGDLI